ncbi:hydantoinase B/oxoprolinase family protein [Bradyrhizobium sp. CB1015]|uniref:hydantoinase B/oxoprolinase family protein n=1 Tax=Bradyrhizobium sp. CB1015 TaxID=2976822 RepID=UPI0021AA7FC6|nr:hydantoinase B/oxoprolinase family protein [Bradyrhizobium sp. CB1015]UWU89069.1 hydantoinase B/oxoprolinase family protein [Bradyrhizobium sp. CB1015]
MPIPSLEQKLTWLKPTPPTQRELELAAQIDPATFEIGFQRTNDILDEGMDVFVRSCRCAMGIAGDSLVAIMTATGDIVNGSCGTYLHAVIPPLVIKYILETYGNEIKDGDLWFANDAVYGGVHNPDQMVCMPVFYDGKLVAWTAALVHTTETGAIEPGGMPVSASSRFEEGMNVPPMRIGRNFRLDEDVVSMFVAFGIRAPSMIAVDLKARCTTADRVRTRLIELCDREGPDYLTGLFRRMLQEAEAGAKALIEQWPDGKYRCVTFSDAVGLKQGLVRSCYMTVDKKGDRMLVDLSETGPETPSPYNAHPQAAIAHFSNYIYEYLFHALPISNGTFASIDFKFGVRTCLSPDPRAATSCSVMISTGVMSAVHNTCAKAMYSTALWKQSGASMGNGGNALVLAGLNQWGAPFADMLAYSINTEGQGARPTEDGMDAFGFPWCVFGRAPNTEQVENEFPLLVPLSNHWKDSCGHGKYRGGVGTVQMWVAHHVPAVYMMAIADNTKLQTPQPLFGGYAPCTVPGIGIRNANVKTLMAEGSKALDLDIQTLLTERPIEGNYEIEFQGRSVRPYNNGDVATFAFSCGGTGYGDPIDRDAKAIEQDIVKGVLSPEAARHVYKVAWDETDRRVNLEQTAELRTQELLARKARGRRYDEFEAAWLKQKPRDEILTYYGSWPDAREVMPLLRA